MKTDNYEAEIAASLKRHRDENARKTAGQTHGDKRLEDGHKNGRASRDDKAAASETKPFRQPNVSAEELMTMVFNPIKYVVPGVIVEGLTLFAGKPKVGKSWLLLHAAIAVARGGFTLGDIKCLEGDVLYCALEDNLRRLQSRMTKLMGMQPWPARLHFRCEMPRLAQGGLDQIRDWIKGADHPRLVIIDTLAMVRAPNKRDQSTYDADYSAVCDLRDLANKHGVAIVLVHHLRKEAAEDAFDTISGTLGLTGAPDTILVLQRDKQGVVLHGRGRDVTEIEKAMTFNADTCQWTITGDATTMRTTSERTAILAALEEAAEPIGPNEIAAAAGMKPANVRYLLGRLVKDGTIQKVERGRYQPLYPSHPHNAPHNQQKPLM
jgi:RecA-family ATPase